jgi:competence protein ComEC
MRNARRFIFALLAAIALLSSWASMRASHQEMLEVYVLDVGQGDAIYVRTPSGRDMLVDGGRSVSVLRRLSEIMPWDDRFIDVVVATHPDADHIGGLPPVLERYGVGVFVEPGIESGNFIDDEVHRLLLERGIRSVLARRGMVVDFGDGALFDILYPDGDVSNLRDANDASIVGMVRFGSTSVMLTGDAPQSVERQILSLDGAFLSSEILKAGHHGSRTSSADEFVRAVSPRWAVISAGKDNSYHHPHEEVIGLFRRLGIEIVRTDDSGTISFVSDGSSFWRK